nr:TetR/AcrR family transcriptional regulator [Granulicoccus phenolivorans]
MAGNRGDTRQRILEAARTVAREHGYGGTTMAMIQKAAGVHPGSLYWHFKDKDSLFTGMIQDAYESATSSYAGIATTGNPNPVLAALSGIVDNPARFGLWRFNVQLMLDTSMAESATAGAIRELRVRTKAQVVQEYFDGLDPAVVERYPQLPAQLAEYALTVIEGCALARVAGQPADEERVTAAGSSVIDACVAEACETVGVPVPAAIRRRLSGAGAGHLLLQAPVVSPAEKVSPAKNRNAS